MDASVQEFEIELPVSVSSRVYELLQQHDTDVQFSAMELQARLGLPPGKASVGAVSGFLSKAEKAGMVTRVGFKSHRLYYRVIDPTAIMVTRMKPGPGAAFGRTVNRRKVGPCLPQLAPPFTVATCRDELLALAVKVEQMEPDLSQVSLDTLLTEIKRRFSK